MVDLFLSDLPSGHAVLAVDCQQALLVQQGEWMMQAAIGGISSALGMLLADKVGGVGVMSHPDDDPPLPPKLMANATFESEPPKAMYMPDDGPPIPPRAMSFPADDPPLPPKLMSSSLSELQQPRAMSSPADDPPRPPK